MVRYPKERNLLTKVRLAMEEGRYAYTKHAIHRQSVRIGVTDGDVKNAIAYGWHEKNKDKWSESSQTWVYAIRGESLDRDQIRICVTLLHDAVVIVTLINLDKDDTL